MPDRLLTCHLTQSMHVLFKWPWRRSRLYVADLIHNNNTYHNNESKLNVVFSTVKARQTVYCQRDSVDDVLKHVLMLELLRFQVTVFLE